MRNIFIVKDADNTDVLLVTPSTVEKSLTSLVDDNVRRKDIASVANDYVASRCGQSITHSTFGLDLDKLVKGLNRYSSMSPFEFIQQTINQ